MSHSAPAGSSVGASTNAGAASGGSTTIGASGAAPASGSPGAIELPLPHAATITTTNAIRIGRTLPDAVAPPSLDGSRTQFVTRVLRRIVRRGQREGERAGVARPVGAA